MPDSIQLGLTFNGGVSLVVFQAGVAFELVRAVQFSRACDGGPLAGSLDADLIKLPADVQVPRLVVDVVTGTSSGGMAAIQLALALGGVDAEAVLARMLHTWIDAADFARLIPATDCPEQGLLTVQPSRDLMEALLAAANGKAAISSETREQLKLEHDLDCYLTLTNFNGLREPVVLREPRVKGGTSRAQRSFPTTRHLEYELIDDDAIGRAASDPDEHERIVTAVLATAGFPVAFAPIVRPSTAIEEELPLKDRTTFAYIDGGVVDNQPLTVALDALADRPALDRRLFFIDPRVTWCKPGYGDADPDLGKLDPLTIFQRLGDISRTDSVHQDLERIRTMEEQQDLISALREQLLAGPALQQALRAVYRLVRERRFNVGAWALWTLIGGDDPAAPTALVTPAVREAWAKVANCERLALRVRLAEHCEKLGLAPGNPALDLLAEDGRWLDYYRALAIVRDMDRRFRQLRYLVWTRHLQHQADAATLAAHQTAIAEAFDTLAKHAKALADQADALLDACGAALFGQDTDAADTWRAGFLDYARSMQVLEALAGTSYAPALRVRRITPFDIYADDAERGTLQPLAGGSLGAFGGFLDPLWRANDFMVGRLVMRRRLQDEGLIPVAAMPAFLAWSRHRDVQLLTRLRPDSPEYRALTAFCQDPPALPPYACDESKAGCLLRPEAMTLGGLPAWQLVGRVPGLARSLGRLRRRNVGKLPYRLLGPVLGVALPATSLLALIAWSPGNGAGARTLTTEGLVRRLRRLPWLLLTVLLTVLVLGFVIGRWFPH